MAFKGYKRQIKLEFDYKEVKDGIPNVKKQMAILNSEFKKTYEEAKTSGKEIDKLGTRYDYLSNKVKIQSQEVEEYRKKLEKAQNAQGNNTKAIQNATTSLEIAKSKLGQTEAQLEQVTKELDKQKSTLGKTSDEWDQLSKKTTEIGKDLSLKLTAPLLAAGAGSFKMASDLTENINKVDEVFEGNAEVVKQWAESSLRNIGVARSTALDMASLFGDMGDSMGLASKDVLEYSTSLTQLAGDLASYKNIKVEVAKTALASVYTGETESLKKLGVVMTQANLQEYAYSQNIRKKVTEMTQAEKVQLRYNYVMSVTEKAQGDFARTSEDASNQARIFKEGIKELGENFGNEILPTITPVITFLNNLIEGLSGLSDGTKKFIVIAGGLIALVGPVLVAIGSVFKAITNISEGMGTASKAMKGLSKSGEAFKGLLDSTKFLGFVKWAAIIAGVALAIAAVVTALNFLFGKGNEINKFTENMGEMFSGIGGSITEISSRGNNVSRRYVNGSHRNGLPRVPFDGYVAELHEDEEVLKTDDPRNRNNPNGNAGYGDTYVLQVNMEEVDEVYKLINVFNNLKQTKRAGVVKYG